MASYPEPGGASVFETGMITALPAFCMVSGSLAISLRAPSDEVQACFQNLSAGLLIGAVVTDIFPMLKEQLVSDVSPGIREMKLASAALGFFVALGLMYALEAIEADDEEEDDEGERPAASSWWSRFLAASTCTSSKEGQLGQALLSSLEAQDSGPDGARVRSEVDSLIQQTKALEQLLKHETPDRDAVDKQVHGMETTVHSARRMCRGAEDIDPRNAMRLRYHTSELKHDVQKLYAIDPVEVKDFDRQLTVVGATLGHIHTHAERCTFRRWAPINLTRRNSSKLSLSLDDKREGMSELVAIGSIPWSLTLAVVVDSGVDGMLIGLASSVNRGSGALMAIATAIEMGFLGYSFSIALTDAVKRGPALGLLFVPPIMMFLSSLMASIGAEAVKDRPAFVALISFSMVALLFLVVQELLVEAHQKEGQLGWRVSIWLYIGLFVSMVLDVML